MIGIPDTTKKSQTTCEASVKKTAGDSYVSCSGWDCTRDVWQSSETWNTKFWSIFPKYSGCQLLDSGRICFSSLTGTAFCDCEGFSVSRLRQNSWGVAQYRVGRSNMDWLQCFSSSGRQRPTGACCWPYGFLRSSNEGTDSILVLQFCSKNGCYRLQKLIVSQHFPAAMAMVQRTCRFVLFYYRFQEYCTIKENENTDQTFRQWRRCGKDSRTKIDEEVRNAESTVLKNHHVSRKRNGWSFCDSKKHPQWTRHQQLHKSAQNFITGAQKAERKLLCLSFTACRRSICASLHFFNALFSGFEPNLQKTLKYLESKHRKCCWSRNYR